MAVLGSVSASVTASWDTQPRPTSSPSVNPSLKNNNFKKIHPQIPQTTRTQTSPLKKDSISASELLKLNSTTPKQGELDESYLGYETWLPVPPNVKKPRSIYNAASLAYIGDCIYELYARRHFLFPPLNVDEYNDRVMAVVRCEAQDELLKKILNEDYLSEEERDILRWGKNINSGNTRATRRAGVAVYNRASSLEALVGYLYLTNTRRLEELMLKLGFSTGASTQLILEESRRAS